MGERSLAYDYIRTYSSRLSDGYKSTNHRGKRINSGSITTYATSNFSPDDVDIVRSTIRNGLKVLVLEESNLLPVEKRAGFMGFIAIAHRSFCRMNSKDVLKEFKSGKLS